MICHSADSGNGSNQRHYDICPHDDRGVAMNLQLGVQNFKLSADQR
jgi:hypothetical protein